MLTFIEICFDKLISYQYRTLAKKKKCASCYETLEAPILCVNQQLVHVISDKERTIFIDDLTEVNKNSGDTLFGENKTSKKNYFRSYNMGVNGKWSKSRI